MDYLQIIQSLVALILVLSLIALISYILRRYTNGLGLSSPKAPTRITVLESRQIDPKRRVVLLQCDETEYLLMTGQENDLLLDSKKIAKKAAKPRKRKAK